MDGWMEKCGEGTGTERWEEGRRTETDRQADPEERKTGCWLRGKDGEEAVNICGIFRVGDCCVWDC